MSYYYEYKFTSPEDSYAIVKEEFKSYFNTGAVDDVMFGTWTKKCLEKLGNSSFPIAETVINICDYWGHVPPDWFRDREAWVCANHTSWVLEPNAYYTNISTKLDSTSSSYSDCPSPSCENPDIITDTWKSQTQRPISISRERLLIPGNISGKGRDGYRRNPYGENRETFQIKNRRMYLEIPEAVVDCTYYAIEYDQSGYPMIPDNYRIREFIEAFIKMKVIEQLSNQVVDETAKQLEAKLERYKKEHGQAFIMADLETKKQTVWQKKMAIQRDLNRNRIYEISDTNRHYHIY
jgi:hypothetical protein